MKIKTKLYLIMALLAAIMIGEALFIVNIVTIPMQKRDIIEKAWQGAYDLQKLSPLLSREEEQRVVADIAERDPQLTYILILDKNGKALVHSNPERVGRVFDDPETLSCARDGKSLQQIYTRDEGIDGSPYQGEKVIDIQIPDYNSAGEHIGAIKVGLSLDYINQVAFTHYKVLVAGVLILLLLFYIAARKLYLSIISSLKKTVSAIRKVKRGQYDHITEVEDDELGFLAHEFNDMASRISELMADLEEARGDMETRIKQRTVELAAEKERLAVTLGSIGEGVISTNMEGLIMLGNETVAEILDMEPADLLGKKLDEVLQLTEVGEGHEAMVKGKTVVEIRNHSLVTGEGNRRIIDGVGSPIRDDANQYWGMVWVLHDITEKQRFEEQLIKASKIESLEILAGGLAHDFKNLLTVIAGNISMARVASEGKLNEYGNEFLVEAEKASIQAQGLAQQLLAFSRGGEPVIKTVATGSLLRNCINFALSGSEVSCKFLIPEYLWSVEVDEGQISQVLNNLVINAIQSMSDEGVILISASNQTIGEDAKLPLAPGRYVNIAIADQGKGILEKYRERVFEPYFTTKENGSGLGLAAVHSIIKKHGGYLTFESKVNEGTTFYIYLPVKQI